MCLYVIRMYNVFLVVSTCGGSGPLIFGWNMMFNYKYGYFLLDSI